MALFGATRDINLFTTINRELLGDIVNQQCSFYQLKLEQTTFNLYGEAAGGKFYDGPTLFNCLIDRKDQTYPESEFGVDFNWSMKFMFLREDLEDANIVPDVGDLILYQRGYYQVDTIIANQYFVGKNPSYPNEANPLNPGLGGFGSNFSVICEAHYEPADKFGISKERF
tara:strand:- start:2708 stop:3217 length:510 start_codon:yes stop_codon:yes gene_type:complete